jgi:hypothetical protein
MSDKYNSFKHIEVLSELNVLYVLANETQTKINTLNKTLAKIKGLEKEKDEIPF